MLESLRKNESFTYTKLSPEEMKSRGILGRLVGPCADFTIPTRNGRKYEESLWDRVFDDEIVNEKIKNKCLFGELGHPLDREEVDPEKIAIALNEVPKKNDKGQLVPVIEDGNYKLVDRESPLGIKRRTCIAESQAFGTPIWDSPNSADAWSELRKVFFTIYENMHITRLNSASAEQLSILNECASLYGKNSFKKIIRQFLMTGNARLLPRLSLEKANALRDLKKSISLDFLANFTPSI